MKKFIQLLIVATVATTGNIYAQGIYAGDALRFSRTDYGSSARFKGLGNAQISLGGDISSIGGNPAGLGMFTRSEFTISPEFNNTRANINYLGQQTKSTKNMLNLNQAAAVWYNPIVKAPGSDLNKGLISIVWGVGYNRNNDFSVENNFSGVNSNSSIADSWAQRANGQTPANFQRGSVEKMAFDSYLIDKQVGSPSNYFPATSQTNVQNQSEVREGSTSEMNFAAGLNFSNKFYLGASIGFVNVRYVTDRLYTESGTIINTVGPNDPAPDPSNPNEKPNPHIGQNYDLTYRSNQNTTGAGVNGRIGLIYKPVNTIRLGATFQTPTWMHMEEDFAEVIDTRFSGGGSPTINIFNDVANSNMNYNLRTPYKGSFGASVIIGQNALLTADVDYVDYSSTKLTVSDGYRDLIRSENQFIKDNYTHAFNYRVGGEYRIDQFSLRAGYGINGSPYKEDPKNRFDVKYYSGGIGYRVNEYYVDLAYQRTETHNTLSPYELADFSEPVATSKLSKNNVFLTVGVRF